MLEKISRQVAIDRSLKKYFTGKPCPHGHISERFVSSYGCVECSLENTKAWRSDPNNKRIAKESHNKWLHENADKVQQSCKKYYSNNKALLIEKSSSYAKKNSASVNQKRRARYRAKHPLVEKIVLSDAERLARNKAYSRKHLEKLKNGLAPRNPKRLKYEQNRRAKKLQAVPCWIGELDDLVFEGAIELRAIRQNMFGFNWHVDHMIPLQSPVACGFHCATNIQVIPSSLNSSKRNKMIFCEIGEWIQYA